MTQNFKGDALELKMQNVAGPVFDQTDLALNDFYEGAYESSPFLLMLYDEGRMPFSDRIPRDAFVDFIKEALRNFPVTGTYESYLFVLRSIFGADAEIFFDVPAAGKLTISINASTNTEYDFIAREFVDGEYVFHEMIDYDLNTLTFRGIAGIESEYELSLLFSEIMPAGIFPTIQLTFISRYDFIGEDGDGIYDVITDIGDQIIFYEIGG